jgi:hypothetical protein
VERPIADKEVGVGMKQIGELKPSNGVGEVFWALVEGLRGNESLMEAAPGGSACLVDYMVKEDDSNIVLVI